MQKDGQSVSVVQGEANDDNAVNIVQRQAQDGTAKTDRKSVRTDIVLQASCRLP